MSHAAEAVSMELNGPQVFPKVATSCHVYAAKSQLVEDLLVNFRSDLPKTDCTKRY